MAWRLETCRTRRFLKAGVLYLSRKCGGALERYEKRAATSGERITQMISPPAMVPTGKSRRVSMEERGQLRATWRNVLQAIAGDEVEPGEGHRHAGDQTDHSHAFADERGRR